MTTTERLKRVSSVTCHPEHGPHHAHGMCGRCYLVQRRVRLRAEQPRQPRWRHTVQLAQRAERLRAELEAAGSYSPIPCTWPAIAAHLGVKPRTLEKVRERAKWYAAREES